MVPGVFNGISSKGSINIIPMYRIIHYILLNALLLTGFSCTLGLDETQKQSISQQDVDAVSQIIGESLSDENAGMIGSIYDAIALISNNGFVQWGGQNTVTGGHDGNTGRGNESEIQYRYHSTTGEHELSFRRLINAMDYAKEVQDTLKYIYQDAQGSFITDLNLVDGNAHNINFKAGRQGNIETAIRNSFFTRRDTFLVSGLESSASIISMNGIHRGAGFFQSVSTVNNTLFARSYELEVNFLNIRIQKSVLTQNISMEQGISGMMTYSLVIEDPNNASVSRTIKGSMEMVGDGTATLRFENSLSLYQVNLDDGEVNNQQEEFEGRIVSVNVTKSTFKLANGLTVKVSEGTHYSASGDLFNLAAIQTALLQTPYVRAEGEGSMSGGIFQAAEIEIELDEDNDDANDDIDFDQQVISVDLQLNTFTLNDGTVIGVDVNTVIESDGDYLSLSEVQTALNSEVYVVADGEAQYIESDSLRYLAISVEFEEDHGDSSGSGDGTGEDLINFKGEVQSVDLSANTLSLYNGAVIQLTDTTEIGGDLRSLQEVQEALNTNAIVNADGKGVEDPDNPAINLVAVDIEFDVED